MKDYYGDDTMYHLLILLLLYIWHLKNMIDFSNLRCYVNLYLFLLQEKETNKKKGRSKEGNIIFEFSYNLYIWK